MNRNIREQGGSKDQGAEVRRAEGAGGQQNRQESRNLPDDFGDLEQYVELSHIGSGEHHIIIVILTVSIKRLPLFVWWLFIIWLISVFVLN